MINMERLDLIVFGATGFTGKYTVAEVHRIVKNGERLTWGIAGRSQSKLEKIIKDLEKKTGDDLSNVKIIVADVCDEDSLKDMSKQTKVVINCCGPYRFYGEPVVKACIETKTHHVDVSGEPAYMEGIQLDYNEAAKEAGVYIISACGFDSIPADMGVVFLQNNFKGVINSAETYIGSHLDSKYRRAGDASIHYGTFESAVYGISQMSELSGLRKKLFPERLPSLEPKLEPKGILHKSSIDGSWYLPFLGSDRPVVMRSQRFFYEQEKRRPAQMYAYIGFPSLLAALVVMFFAAIFGIMTKFAFGRKLLLNHPKFFTGGFISHEGPPEDAMENTKFWVTIYGEGWKENTAVEKEPPNTAIKVKVSGVNPGYGATCTALVYSAITILKDAKNMPSGGGVLSPGAAFAKTSLIENLQKNNLTFEVLSIEDIKR